MAQAKSENENRNSRVLIHAGASTDDVGKHPEWRGSDDQEISDCTFAASENDLSGKEAMSDINHRIEHVLDRAPSDSTANLLLRKSKDGYRAFFKIRSAQGKFVGFIRGKNLIETVDKVLSQVRGQIENWKETRRLADERG